MQKPFFFLLFLVVCFCFVSHLSQGNSWQALLSLINHSGQLCKEKAETQEAQFAFIPFLFCVFLYSGVKK